MSEIKKTNAMRLLDQAHIPYKCYEYETVDGKIDAVSVARKIGQEPEQVFKTLVTISPSANISFLSFRPFVNWI